MLREGSRLMLLWLWDLIFDRKRREVPMPYHFEAECGCGSAVSVSCTIAAPIDKIIKHWHSVHDQCALIDDAERRMSLEEAREIWDDQGNPDLDPIKLKAAERIITAAGWQ